MNAAEQTRNLELASKVAALVNLFKSKFPDARADLKPWMNDPDTQELVDPDSIDVGFHFPGWSRLFQSRSILMQLRFHRDPVEDLYQVIGVELAGFDHQGKQWQLSTIENWQFVGTTSPATDVSEKLRQFCKQALEIFERTNDSCA